MYALIHLSLGQTMAGLSELAELRVLRDGSHGLEFVNELIRASAYASVPTSVAAGAALEGRGSPLERFAGT